MPPFPIGIHVLLLLVMTGLPAIADEPETVLNLQLNNIESRIIQRQNRPPRTSDLLTNSKLRIAERRLNTLKTRTPRNAKIPLLHRKLDRIKRSKRF